MRVLLIPAKSNYPAPKPSADIMGQGLPYVAAALRAAGHEIRGLNVSYRWGHGSGPLVLESALREAVEEFRPELIGVGGLSSDYLFVRDAFLFLRRLAPDVPIVGGGGLFTYDAEFIFDHLHPDFALVGDAEETVVRLADCLQAGADVGQVSNLWYWRDGQAVQTPLHHSTADLDALAFPDYGAFDYSSYFQISNQVDNWLLAHTRPRPRVLPVSAARSCPFQCTFCCHTPGGPKYRGRSIDNTIAEILHEHEALQFNLLLLYDELFSVNVERIGEFCHKIKDAQRRLGADWNWTCSLRVGKVGQETLKMMKDAGCAWIGYGLESADQSVLDSMKKQITVEQIRQSLDLTEAVGIGCQGNFIFGDVAETPRSMRRTIDFFHTRCKDLMVSCGYVTPFPGSALFDHCVDRGLIGDRPTYYERLATFDKKVINMTTMPNDQFAELAGQILGHELDDAPVAEPVSCEDLGPCPGDAGAPFELRRADYGVRVVCPHCGRDADYVYPLRFDDDHTPAKVPAFCPACHKRLWVRIPPEMAGPSPRHPILSLYALAPASLGIAEPYDVPVLAGAHEGYNLVRYRHRTYALAHSLGPVDVTTTPDDVVVQWTRRRTCVLAQTNDAAKQRIDEIRQDQARRQVEAEA